jgi:hypothetical protein
MKINDIIKILNISTNIIVNNISKNIIQITKNKDETNSNLKIKFKNNFLNGLIIGFSINLKYVKIKHNGEIIKIDNITKIGLKIKKNEILEIIPSNLNKNYIIYINFYNPDMMLDLEESKILNKIEKNIFVYQYKKSINIKKIIIILTTHIKSIGYFFKMIYEKQNIICELKYSSNIEDFLELNNYDNTLYLILYANIITNLLPKRFIFYQIEQSNSMFLTKYIKKFKYIGNRAEKIWEYSKCSSYIYDNYFHNKLEWKPMPFVLDNYIYENNNFNSCVYDIFFYGNKNIRREKILLELSKQFNIKIGFGCYGNEKKNNILKSKIILNLHYYKDAGLETCRINEILNFNKIIISEKSPTDIENMNLYKDIVIFVDEIKDDLDNLEVIIEKIKFYLDEKKYLDKINYNRDQIKILEEYILNSYILKK